jgi:hypothetical protein
MKRGKYYIAGEKFLSLKKEKAVWLCWDAYAFWFCGPTITRAVTNSKQERSGCGNVAEGTARCLVCCWHVNVTEAVQMIAYDGNKEPVLNTVRVIDYNLF